MDQKWMTSTEQSNKNSLPNLVIYLWGLAEEAATFKMHCGPCFPCSILQGYFCIQLEAELCEKLHVCLSNYLRFRNLSFSAVTKRIARIFDIKTESQKTFMVALPKENFQYSCQPQQIFYVTVRLIPSSLPSVFSLLSKHGVFFWYLSWSVLSKVPRLGWSKAVNPAHFWGQHTHTRKSLAQTCHFWHTASGEAFA